MRVGIYVDAFNVYYGGRELARRAQQNTGWKWLDLAGLASSLIDPTLWAGASPAKLVYCSAPRSKTGDVKGSADQQSYFAALQRQSSRSGLDYRLELGRYIHTEKSGLLVASRGGPMVPWSTVQAAGSVPTWLHPRKVTHVDGVDYALVDIKTFEEKGSDVNVATHLILDVLSGSVEAAIVFSNDSDLAMPVREARSRVPVGLVNPSSRPTSQHLKGERSDGVGRHWWRRLSFADLAAHQLPDPCGGSVKPTDW